MNTEIRKQLRTTWTRQMARIANLVQVMEKELDKLREKKVSSEFIAQKSARIDTMIDAINTADEIITAQRNEIVQLRIENQLLASSLSQEQQLDLIWAPNTDLIRKFHETQKKPASS